MKHKYYMTLWLLGSLVFGGCSWIDKNESTVSIHSTDTNDTNITTQGDSNSDASTEDNSSTTEVENDENTTIDNIDGSDGNDTNTIVPTDNNITDTNDTNVTNGSDNNITTVQPCGIQNISLHTSTVFTHITLQAEVSDLCRKVSALNLTLAQEQNRSLETQGYRQDDGTTYYVYNIPLVKGENRIMFNAENNRTLQSAQKEIVIESDANQTIPLQLHADPLRGVGSLTTTITASTLLDAKTMLFDTDGDGIIDRTLTPKAHSENNVTYYIAELNATYTQEGRYRPRVTVETQEGVLFSSDVFALSLDVVSDANQKDPKGAEPIDIAKAFVKALIEDDRESVERLTGYSANLLAFIYEDRSSLERAKRLAREIDPDSWKQTYRTNGSIKVTAEANDDQYGKIPITIEVMYAYGDGAGSGRMLYVSDVY